MFSILICSVNGAYLENLKKNIATSIGVPYELLAWNNLENPKPITEVYNLLAAKAQHPYWCFIHEDIRFDTENWGRTLISAFEKHPETGLIGIAGSKYKSKTPSGWSTGISSLDFCNIFHQDAEGYTEQICLNPSGSVFEPVVNIDGVFMAIRREVWQDARYDDVHLRGFHLYDIDFSFRVWKKWNSAVIFNIDIMHFTQGGHFGDEWVRYTLDWHQRFSDQLPNSNLKNLKTITSERKIRIFWLRRLSVEKIRSGLKLRWIRQSKVLTDPGCWPFVLLFLAGPRFKMRKSRRRPS